MDAWSTSRTIIQESPFNLTCAAVGNPPPYIIEISHWEEKLNNLKEIKNSQSSSITYEVEQSGIEHAGPYQCRAVSTIGQEVQNIDLIIRGMFTLLFFHISFSLFCFTIKLMFKFSRQKHNNEEIIQHGSYFLKFPRNWSNCLKFKEKFV